MTDYFEPWYFDVVNGIHDRDRGSLSDEDMIRAVSCVNACCGIEDPERVVPLLVAAAVSMLKYAKGKTFYPLREECRFVEHLTKLSDAIAALEIEG